MSNELRSSVITLFTNIRTCVLNHIYRTSRRKKVIPTTLLASQLQVAHVEK